MILLQADSGSSASRKELYPDLLLVCKNFCWASMPPARTENQDCAPSALLLNTHRQTHKHRLTINLSSPNKSKEPLTLHRLCLRHEFAINLMTKADLCTSKTPS